MGVCDIDQDGSVTSADVTALVDIILERESSALGDVNADGYKNILDLMYVYSVVLGRNPDPYSPTYYVDYEEGDDTNTGTDSAHPWKHCPGDSNATANANRTLTSGQIVAFKGGISYLGYVTFNGSGGGETTRIIYASGDRCSPAWGTGSAVIDGQLTRKYGFTGQSRSYITIDGIEIRNIGVPTSAASGIYTYNCSYLTVVNCKIHDVNWSSSTYTIAYGILGDRATYHDYHDNEIYNVTDKCIEWNGGLVRGASTAHHNEAYRNVLHNTTVQAVVFTCDNSSLHGNIIYEVHDGHQPSGPAGWAFKVNVGSDNAIYNNLIYNSEAGIGVLVGDRNLIYQNTIYGIGANTGGWAWAWSQGALALYDDGSASGWSVPRITGNEFKNNIIYYLTGGMGSEVPLFVAIKDGDQGTGNLIQNNLFLKAEGDITSTPSRVRHRNGSTDYYGSVSDFASSFNAWEGGSGNAASGNVVDEPTLSGGTLGALGSRPTGFTGGVPNDDGFALLEGSPAIGIGLTLGSPYNVDIAGTARSNYDAGAYEFSG